MRFLLGLLPKKYRIYAEVGLRMFDRLNSTAEIEAAARSFLTKMDNGMTVIEWSQWGKEIGILGKHEEHDVPVAPTV